MLTKDRTLALDETLDTIRSFIRNRKGDVGRLNFIQERLQKRLPLYKSDQKYLETKINAKTVFEGPKQLGEDERTIISIKRLIKNGIGDPGRLDFMLGMAVEYKPLFKTDSIYLQKKLEILCKRPKQNKLTVKPQSQVIRTVIPEKIPQIEHTESVIESQQPKPMPQPKIPTKEVENLETELQNAKQLIQKLENELLQANQTIKKQNAIIEEKKLEIEKLRKETTKPSPTIKENIELAELKTEIDRENQKIKEQTDISDMIKSQRLKLEQLVSFRKEYEKKIVAEKAKLEEQIRLENQKITEKDKLVEELAKKQQNMEKSRVEREVVLEQIKQEQTRLDEEILNHKKELEKTKAEYDELVKRFKAKQENSSKSTNDES